MLLSELPGMLREHPGQRGGLRPGCARAGWREVGAGSPAGWLLLMFHGSWFPPPPVATHGAWHLLITSSRTCADLINSVPRQHLPALASQLRVLEPASPASRQPSWLWLLPKCCQGGRGAARDPPPQNTVARRGAKHFDVTRQDVVKHLVMLG